MNHELQLLSLTVWALTTLLILILAWLIVMIASNEKKFQQSRKFHEDIIDLQACVRDARSFTSLELYLKVLEDTQKKYSKANVILKDLAYETVHNMIIRRIAFLKNNPEFIVEP
jgi:hypothetical protein